MKRLFIDGLTFRDEEGNQVLMNGINLVCKKKEQGYIEPNILDLLRIYFGRGLNLVRLGIFWDGVEPEPGDYDDAYLDRVAKVVETAEQYGIYIMLDMHQDLFAAKYADGAPDWATLDEGLYHPESCTIWYEAYLSSQAIIKAADNFWANKEAADGVGLLDHYEAMWEHIADRFKSFSNVIGFEPMNEPYMGSIAPQAFGMAISKIKETNPDFDLNNQHAVTPEEQGVMQTIMTEQFMKFDKETLMPFYNRILRAIRKVSDIPLVTGGNIYCSSFIETGIENLTGPEGQTDHRQIYGPHGYDAVVDTDNYAAFNKENVQFIFSQKRASQLKLQVPVIVGEWGAFPSKDYTNSLIEHMVGILEEYQWSSTYWVYYQGMENDPNYSSLERGFPSQVAGNLQGYHYDYAAKRLTVKWDAKKNGETVFYVPNLSAVTEQSISSTGNLEIKMNKLIDTAGGYVTVIPNEEGPIEINIG